MAYNKEEISMPQKKDLRLWVPPKLTELAIESGTHSKFHGKDKELNPTTGPS